MWYMANYSCYLGVKKKVAAVNSALCGWPDTVFDSLMYPSMVCGPISHIQTVLFHSCLMYQGFIYKIMAPFLMTTTVLCKLMIKQTELVIIKNEILEWGKYMLLDCVVLLIN